MPTRRRALAILALLIGAALGSVLLALAVYGYVDWQRAASRRQLAVAA